MVDVARIVLTGNPQLPLKGRIKVFLRQTLASLFDFNWSLQINKIVKRGKKKKGDGGGKWQESGTYKEGEIVFWKTNCRMKNCGQNRWVARSSVAGPWEADPAALWFQGAATGPGPARGGERR